MNNLNNSHSTSTSILFGGKGFDKLFFNAQNMSLPGITFNNPSISGRYGSQINLGSDSVEFDELILTVVLDRDWSIYNELIEHFTEKVNLENNTYTPKELDLWVQIKSGSGKNIKRFWFYNAKISNISSVEFDLTDNEDSVLTVTVTFVFDYMKGE